MSTTTDPMRMMRLSAAADMVEKITGERPSASALYRWSQRGIAGVRLQTTYALGSQRVTENQLRAFFEAVAAAKAGEPPPPRSSASSRAIREAEASLERSGI